MSTIPHTTGRQQKEAGMVAIMVTLILMIVVSLIVLGFAQISRRNQRQALDRQLSTQAFYAAETAVNDVSEVIKTAVNGGVAVASKTDCGPSGSYSTSPIIDAASDIEYTCVTVDPDPPELVYSNVGMRGTVAPIIASSGTIASITLSWQSTDDTSSPEATCPANLASNVFVAVSAWNCGYGVLRYDLVPTAGGLSLNGLQSSAMTSFVVPLRPGASGATANPISYPSPAAGANSRLGVICSDTSCQLTINGLNQSQYYMRVSSIYKDVSLQIIARDSSGNTLNLQGAQAVIDATGKAQDVLRRIQVRVPLSGTSSNLLSDYAVQSNEAICKRFATMDGFFDTDADNVVSTVDGSTSNLLCGPNPTPSP